MDIFATTMDLRRSSSSVVQGWPWREIGIISSPSARSQSLLLPTAQPSAASGFHGRLFVSVRDRSSPSQLRLAGSLSEIQVQRASGVFDPPHHDCRLPHHYSGNIKDLGRFHSSGRRRPAARRRGYLQTLFGVPAHFCLTTRSGGKGQPSARARARTLAIFRLRAAAALTTDAPSATRARRRSSSSLVQVQG
jgi:hypothetical protein